MVFGIKATCVLGNKWHSDYILRKEDGRKMRVTREIGFFSLLVLITLFVQNASATLAQMLPTSSYADGAWQGEDFYDEDLGGGGFLRGRVDFAVYDTLGGNEFIEAGFEAPGEGQYIYAYQIFNDYEAASDKAVLSFAVFGIDGAPLDVVEDSISSSEDPQLGIEPSNEYFSTDRLKVVWEFGGKEGFSFIDKGDHSWFLVFSSDAPPVVGDYEIRAPGFPAFSENPEPATIALLGIGGALMFTKRRKSAQ